MAFVDAPHDDAGNLGLVDQRAQEVGAAPLVQPQVLAPASVATRDPSGIADREGADTTFDGPGNDGFGSLVVREPHPAAVARFSVALRGPEFAPPAAAALTPPGRLGARMSGSGFGVSEVDAFLGPDLTA